MAMRKHWILPAVIAACLATGASAEITILHEFAGGPDDGERPWGFLTLSGEMLYGVTSSGGDDGKGVVFRIKWDGTAYSVVHKFVGGSDDGRCPHGSLTLSGKTLYGTTMAGGNHDCGVVFRMNTDGTGYALLHEFADGPNDGRYPCGFLTLSGETLYGTTDSGGDDGDGVVFRMNTDGTGFTLLHEFARGPDDGGRPDGSVTLSGDTLYGMTCHGGDDDGGVVFRMKTDGTGYTILHEFAGYPDDGAHPHGSPTLSDGVIYGFTAHGGPNSFGYGVAFRMSADGTGYTILHEFAGGSDDGRNPYGSPTLRGDTLYGIAGGGGDYSDGVAFKMNTDGTGFALLHEFVGGAEGGRGPTGSVRLRGGTFYGMTAGGGDDDVGVVFSMQLVPGVPHVEALELFYEGRFGSVVDPAKEFLAVGQACQMWLLADDLHGNVTNYLHGITGIRVTFDTVVTFSVDAAAAFSYEATPEQSGDKTFTAFTPPTAPSCTVDNGTGKTVITITFADGESKNRWLKAIIDASQVSANGMDLDGELPSPLTLPSGNGTAGGNAEFIIGHRFGDVDGNYRCLLNDAVLVRNRVSGTVVVGISNAYDVDKNERVLLNDAILTRSAVSGTALPTLP